MKTAIWKELLNRLQSESPKFFIVLRWIFGILACVAIAFKWVVAKELWEPSNAKLIDAIQEICGYILTAASTMWFSSLLPVKDNNSTTTPTTTTPPPSTDNLK